MTKTKDILEVSSSVLKNFSCGTQELDDYLKRFAKYNHKKNIGKTFVLLEADAVIGLYTISMASIEFQSIPESLRKNLPRYPIPAARIERLAVDTKHQRKQLGRILLIDALDRIRQAAQVIAAHAVIVDAKNDKAKKFYENLGFIPYQDLSMSLYLPMLTVEELFT